MKQSKPKIPRATKQVEKFREAAREVETDDREKAFNDALKRVAKATGPIGKAQGK